MILPNLNHPGGKKFCSEGNCLMLSMFKVSAKLVHLFPSTGLEESRFFCWHLDIIALYWKPAMPCHKGNFRRWKHPAKRQLGLASSVLALLFCPRLWFAVGQNRDPRLLQRETRTPRECLGHPWAWLGSPRVWRAILSWHQIFVGMRRAATSKCPFPTRCHQLWKKKKKSYRKALIVLLSLVKDFQANTC